VAFTASFDAIDLGTVCPEEERGTRFAIRNSGSIGARIHASIAPPFQLDATSWHVGSDAEQELTLHLPAGGGEGEFTGVIELFDSICGTRLSIPVYARVEGTKIEADPLLLTTYDGIPVDGTTTVTNRSGRDLELTTAIASDGRFVVVAPGLPVTIPAGGSLPLTVRYTPSDAAPVAARLDLAGDPCALVLSTPLAGNNIPSFMVEIPAFEGSAGERIEVPLRLNGTERSIFALGKARRFTAAIRFNASLLIPGPDMPVGIVRDGERSITIEGEWDGTSGILANLSFTAALGDSEATPIVIDRFLWNDNGSTALTSNGLFRLLDLCREGGLRLIAGGTAAALKESYPNPAGSTTTIEFQTVEEGATRLIVIDQLGRTVATIMAGNLPAGRHTAAFDVSALPSGTYIYLLETPTERLSRRLEVRR
jgi:hypothetical protein